MSAAATAAAAVAEKRTPDQSASDKRFSNVRELVWIQTSYIGDVVLTTAALRLAAASLPGIRQHMVTTPAGAAALKGMPELASLTVLHKRKSSALATFLSVRKTLKQKIQSPEAALTLLAHRSPRSALLAQVLGYRRLAYNEGALSWLAQATVPRVAVLHEAARIGLLLTPLGVSREAAIDARPWLPSLPPRPDALWSSFRQGDGRPLVGLAPGSVWGTKRWTLEGYRELARRLLTHQDVNLVLIGSDAEKAQCDAIARELAAGERVLNLAGQTSLTDLRELLPMLSVLVSGDSSPVHFAAALDVPTVALFGATVPEMGFAPLAKDSVSLGVKLACRPCSDHGPMECPLGHFKCMRDLSVESVYGAVVARLVKEK